MEDGDAMLLPTVKWAQRKDTLSLIVILQECQPPSIVLRPRTIEFKAVGVGAKGLHLYGFNLDFYKLIDAESCIHRITGSGVEIFLTKEGEGEWWPRLTQAKKSPHFLKLNFDKWKTESDEEENKMMDDDLHQLDADFVEEIRKQKLNMEMKRKKAKNSYLILYNVVQLLGFSYIFILCLINLIRGGSKFFPFVYEACGQLVHFSVMFSVMEVVHPLTGMTKGPWLTALMQVAGRNFALFCLWLVVDDIKSYWFVTALFMTWSAIELVRYPNYILQLIERPSAIVTWLRYTIWIPLYPLGFFLELLVYVHSSRILTEHGWYELNLPNVFNITLKFSWLIFIYLAVFPFGMIIMLRHMWKARCRKYSTKKYKTP